MPYSFYQYQEHKKAMEQNITFTLLIFLPRFLAPCHSCDALSDRTSLEFKKNLDYLLSTVCPMYSYFSTYYAYAFLYHTIYRINSINTLTTCSIKSSCKVPKGVFMTTIYLKFDKEYYHDILYYAC